MAKEESLSKELFSLGWLCTKLAWQGSKFIVKNTPKAIVTIVEVRREIVNGINDEYTEFKKEQMKLEMNDTIKMLAHNKSKGDKK